MDGVVIFLVLTHNLVSSSSADSGKLENQSKISKLLAKINHITCKSTHTLEQVVIIILQGLKDINL